MRIENAMLCLFFLLQKSTSLVSKPRSSKNFYFSSSWCCLLEITILIFRCIIFLFPRSNKHTIKKIELNFLKYCFCLSVYISIYISIYLSNSQYFNTSIALSTFFFLYISFYLTTLLKSFVPSIHQYIYPICLAIYLIIYLFIYLSIYQFIYLLSFSLSLYIYKDIYKSISIKPPCLKRQCMFYLKDQFPAGF